MRYRLMATYRGVPYEAGIGPASTDVVLFAACPPPEDLGFEPAPGHWRKRVVRAEIDALWESRPVGIFRGEPCIVLDDLGDRLHIAYLGTDPGRAALLGYWQVDRGVFELLARRDEVTGLAEQRIEKPLQWSVPPAQPGTAPAYPYGTAPWPVPPVPPGPPEPAPPAAFAEPPAWPPPSPDLPMTGNGTAAGHRPPDDVNGSALAAVLAPPAPVPPARGAPLRPESPPAAGQPGHGAGPGPGAAPGPGALPVPPEAPPPPGQPAGCEPPARWDPVAGQHVATPRDPAGRRDGRRSARRQRVPTRAVFSELADLAAIPRHAYALESEVDGAMCLLPTEAGYEVFLAANGARHEARSFPDEEAAYFYLFGVLVAESIRSGRLATR